MKTIFLQFLENEKNIETLRTASCKTVAISGPVAMTKCSNHAKISVQYYLTNITNITNYVLTHRESGHKMHRCWELWFDSRGYSLKKVYSPSFWIEKCRWWEGYVSINHDVSVYYEHYGVFGRFYHQIRRRKQKFAVSGYCFQLMIRDENHPMTRNNVSGNHLMAVRQSEFV